MARIRTVKPELFRHHDLFTLEKETGLPVRLAFIGLLTVADREGRFKWRPEEVKLDVLPYDHDIDFSRVLDALATRGFVKRYEVDGRFFGVITQFKAHQHINGRESDSRLPPPPSDSKETTSTREPRVDDVTQTCTWGKGKGKGKDIYIADERERPIFEESEIDSVDPYPFEKAWLMYPGCLKSGRPRRGDKNEACKKWVKLVKSGKGPELMLALEGAVKSAEEHPDDWLPYMPKWLNGDWMDFIALAKDNPPFQESDTGYSQEQIDNLVRMKQAGGGNGTN